MAIPFNLGDFINDKEIRDMFIDYLENELVARNVFPTTSIIGASSIKIPGLSTVATAAYTGAAPSATDTTDTSVILSLDSAQYFLQRIDKIDDHMTAVKVLAKVLAAGAYELANVIDEAAFTEAATTSNNVTQPSGGLDESNVAGWIGDMGVKLSRQKAPKGGRKLVVTPEVSALISQANLTLQTTTAEEAAREGFVGRFGGFDIFESLNLPHDPSTGDTCFATVGDSVVLGIGYQEFGIGDKADDFKIYVKGLVNYGVKLVQDAYLVGSKVTIA